jgi:hypothetical protein
MRYRVREELNRIKDLLLGDSPPPLEPLACFSSPFVLEAAGDGERNGTIELYGYDFDRMKPELVLIQNGNFTDVSAALTRKNDFHLTVKLGSGGVRLSRSSEKLGLAWGNVLHYTIPIVQETSALCEPKIEKIPAGATVRVLPPRIGAAAQGKQTGAELRASVALETVSNAVNVFLCATIIVDRKATFGGCSREQIFTAGSDQYIDRILSDTDSAISSAQRAGRPLDIKVGKSTGPVATWTFSNLNSTPEAAVKLNESRVLSMPADGCISPYAYMEAKRRNELTRETIRRLDPQLARLNPALLKIRPRFTDQAR